MEKKNPWIDQNKQKHLAVRGFWTHFRSSSRANKHNYQQSTVPGAVLRLQIPRKLLISNIAIVA